MPDLNFSPIEAEQQLQVELLRLRRVNSARYRRLESAAFFLFAVVCGLVLAIGVYASP